MTLRLARRSPPFVFRQMLLRGDDSKLELRGYAFPGWSLGTRKKEGGVNSDPSMPFHSFVLKMGSQRSNNIAAEQLKPG